MNVIDWHYLQHSRQMFLVESRIYLEIMALLMSDTNLLGQAIISFIWYLKMLHNRLLEWKTLTVSKF